MSKFLFLCDFYYPRPLPNGVVLDKVTTELIKRGHEVHLIAYRQLNQEAVTRYNGVFVHYVEMRLFYILKTWGEQNIRKLSGAVSFYTAKAINKITKLFNIRRFPMSSAGSVERFYAKTEALHREHGFDAVIALFNPEDTLFAVMKFKQKYPQVSTGAYILDSLIFLAGKKKLPAFLRESMSWKFEQSVYESFDRVYNMETHRVHHVYEKYAPYRDKMVFLDTPLFIPREIVLTHQLYDADKTNIVYMGTLFKSFRNPEYVYKVFRGLNENNDSVLHFYTRGDCERMLLRYEKEMPGAVVREGYVSNSEIENIYANADFLINIGVNNSTNISSKIFDYMSTGKPVIHFYYFDDDVNNAYLEKYPSAILIKMDEALLSENIARLKKFVAEKKGVQPDISHLNDSFEKNKPEFTAAQFESLIH
ncbi:MAG: hypothetical protein LAT75_11650 [Candidatus Cyclonatronum sp.]|uniref:hypothetical protein n=1 Tax=Cyclonatronum sp. TaxID=3024185 RepID=UPI0025C71D72|nr:hypothetical protein [Cyclonatronum sp.]MCH8487512.1 hypothetical protein [Cyclonatronum sp.]